MSKGTPTRALRSLRSLRSRILLLALLVCVLLAPAITGFSLLLRQTQSTIISGSTARLVTVVNTFAKDYSTSIKSSTNNEAVQVLNEGPNPHADAVLRAFTNKAFQRDPGVEGGFYSSATDSLIGYAFPTNDGPGPKQNIPPRERPAILSIASRQRALASQQRLLSVDRKM